jgi:uncharacterized membrane protein
MKKIITFIKKFKYEILLWFFILAYVVCFSFLSIRRFQTLNSHYYDLGIMNQVVYNTSRGKFLEMTDQQLKKNINRMAVHFDPILAAFAPLYKIYPGPETLLVSQTIILALGAWAIFLISEKILKKKGLGLIFSVLYLLYFPVQRANLFDFHAVVLATSFFLFAFYFYLIRKKFWFFFFILLALLTKEHVGLVVAFLGIYLFFFKKDRKLGLLTLITGIIFFIGTMYFIIPYFRQQTHFALHYFGDFGESPSQIIFNIFRHPLVTANHVFKNETYGYVLRLFLPVFYSLFSPLTLSIALPELAINILSINGNMRSIYFHYNAIIVPFVFYSLILGYKNFDNKVKNKPVKIVIFSLFLITNIVSVYLYNPIPINLVKEPFYLRKQTDLKMKTIDDWENKLKDSSIKVATTPILAPFFTERTHYYNFLFDPAYASMGYTDEDVIASSQDVYKLADYVIIDRLEIGDINKRNLAVIFYQRLRNDHGYKMIYSDNRSDNSIEVYKKI